MSTTTVAPSPSAPAADRPWEKPERPASAQSLRAAQARRDSGRRRSIDPATCERDYSHAELEFMQAMQDYKARSGRMFPTWSEVLEVLRTLGYEKSGDDAAWRSGHSVSAG